MLPFQQVFSRNENSIKMSQSYRMPSFQECLKATDWSLGSWLHIYLFIYSVKRKERLFSEQFDKEEFIPGTACWRESLGLFKWSKPFSATVSLMDTKITNFLAKLPWESCRVQDVLCTLISEWPYLVIHVLARILQTIGNVAGCFRRLKTGQGVAVFSLMTQTADDCQNHLPTLAERGVNSDLRSESAEFCSFLTWSYSLLAKNMLRGFQAHSWSDCLLWDSGCLGVNSTSFLCWISPPNMNILNICIK